VHNLTKFITTIEDEGMFGLAQSAIAQSANIVVSVASSAIGTAIHVVSDVSSNAARLVNVPHDNNNNNNSIMYYNDICIYNEKEKDTEVDGNVSKWTTSCHENVVTHVPIRTSQSHDHYHQGDDSPFGIMSIASTIANIMLGAISPLLVQQQQHHYHLPERNVRRDQQILMKRGTTTQPIFLHAETMNSFNDHSTTDLGQFFDANDSCCRSSSNHAESVYYDATSSTRSLSSTDDSFVSSDDAEDNSDDAYAEVNGCHIGDVELLEPEHSIPQHVVLAYDDSTTATISTPTFYLDLSDVLSEEEQDVITSTHEECIVYKENSKLYIVRDTVIYRESFHRVLNILVERSFCIAQMDDDCSPCERTTTDDNPGELCWKPDDRTKKYLERRQKKTAEEWTQILETEVLKWTGSVQNSNCPMLKTRGIIDMSPLELKELLLDCERNHLYNPSSISKTNMHCFADIDEIGGETRIVQNVMKIPIVGGTIQTVSLTHVRCIENGGGYILVSQSVGDDANASPDNPYYSISILRSVPSAEQKTELTNITRISSMPIPKFLMQKVGLMGVMDFFKNLRSLCK
jgi:hypothetical protein